MVDPSLISALLRSVLHGLSSPTTIVIGLGLGWLCRQWWQVVVAALAMQAVFFGYFYFVNLPPEARVMWAALPLGLIAPLAWCAAGFQLKRWLKARSASSTGGGVPRAAWIIIGVIVGGIVGGAVGVGIGVAYVDLAKVSNFEGGAGMMVAFVFMPLGVIAGAVIGGVFASRRAGRAAAKPS